MPRSSLQAPAAGVRVHLFNVPMCIGTDFAMIGLDAIPDAARCDAVADRARRHERTILALSHAQIADFGGNAIEVQGRDGLVLALSSRALQALDQDRRRVLERQVMLLPLDIPTIEHTGGSIRCMIAGLHLSARSQPPVQ